MTFIKKSMYFVEQKYNFDENKKESKMENPKLSF